VPVLLNQLFWYGSWWVMCDPCSKMPPFIASIFICCATFQIQNNVFTLGYIFNKYEVMAPINHPGLHFVLYPSLIRADDRIGTAWYSLTFMILSASGLGSHNQIWLDQELGVGRKTTYSGDRCAWLFCRCSSTRMEMLLTCYAGQMLHHDYFDWVNGRNYCISCWPLIPLHFLK
jgi:hypothetical protein